MLYFFNNISLFFFLADILSVSDLLLIKVIITTLYFFIFIYFSCLVVGIELARSHGTRFLSSYCIYISKHDRLILPIITARFLNLILHLQLFGLLIFGTFSTFSSLFFPFPIVDMNYHLLFSRS